MLLIDLFSDHYLLTFCPSVEALSRLDAVIRRPDALLPDNVMAYDNAVSALGKICQFHRDSINAAQVHFLNVVKSIELGLLGSTLKLTL